MLKSRTGFILVAVCFALPWIGIECGGPVKIYSGLELVGEGGPGILVLLAFVAALAGLIATWKVFGPSSKSVQRVACYLSPILFVIGLLAFLQKLGSSFGLGFGETLQSVGEDMIKKPQWTYGLWGVLLGYVLVVLGIAETKEPEGMQDGRETLSAPK